jgi:hypothetical protein
MDLLRALAGVDSPAKRGPGDDDGTPPRKTVRFSFGEPSPVTPRSAARPALKASPQSDAGAAPPTDLIAWKSMEAAPSAEGVKALVRGDRFVRLHDNVKVGGMMRGYVRMGYKELAKIFGETLPANEMAQATQQGTVSAFWKLADTENGVRITIQDWKATSAFHAGLPTLSQARGLMYNWRVKAEGPYEPAFDAAPLVKLLSEKTGHAVLFRTTQEYNNDPPETRNYAVPW